MKAKYTLSAFLGLLAMHGYSQKGIPPKEDTKKVTITNFPTHLEYSSSLASGLKTARDWQVTPVATGLGKPRMLYIGKKGQLYVTRRDAGDVLMLTDTDKDGKFDDMIRVADFPGVHGILQRRLYVPVQ